MFQDQAKAKINLTLEIHGKREDGYHELQSLVVFADFGDCLSYQTDQPYDLSVSGPYAQALVGENLIQRAVVAFQNSFPDFQPGSFHLEKNLPVASGIGGGSADAAAALRLLAKACNLTDADDDLLYEIALGLGADVPVCFRQESVFMAGVGEQLHPLVSMPSLNFVLVNPHCAVPTGEVFQRLNASPLKNSFQVSEIDCPVGFETPDDLLNYMASHHNDLQNSVVGYAPVIESVLGALEQQQGCQIARMSGSGATCFGIYESEDIACEAAQQVRLKYPDWWCVKTVLG